VLVVWSLWDSSRISARNDKQKHSLLKADFLAGDDAVLFELGVVVERVVEAVVSTAAFEAGEG
jgi:hypothetical protein